MEQENKELQELKEQLSALNAKLDKQAEINDKMIGKALDSSVNRMKNLVSKQMWFCFFALILVSAIVILQGVSTPLIIATIVFLAVNAYIAVIMNMKEKSISGTGDMVNTMKSVLEYKKLNRNSTLVLLPIAILWAVWYVYEIGEILGFKGGREYIFLIVACALGGILGGLCGYFSFYRPSMRQADEIIAQIDELTESK